MHPRSLPGPKIEGSIQKLNHDSVNVQLQTLEIILKNWPKWTLRARRSATDVVNELAITKLVSMMELNELMGRGDVTLESLGESDVQLKDEATPLIEIARTARHGWGDERLSAALQKASVVSDVM